MAAKRVTLADVAAASGIAVSTASLVLAGRGTDVRISQAVQERVKAKALELGYRPNAMSVGLRKGVTSTLGFVSDSVASSRLAGDMIKGAIEAARDRGFMVFVGETSGNLTQEHLLLDAMFDRQVDGLILASMFTQERDLTADHRAHPRGAAQHRTVISHIPSRRPPRRVRGGTQRRPSARRRGPPRHPPRRIRARRLTTSRREPSQARNASPESSRCSTRTGSRRHRAPWRISGLPRDGWMIVNDILERGVPGALLCFNDRLAMGAYQALQEHGLRIPQDVSVVSFDDASIASWMRPGLTTFALPHRSMGKRAAELLISQIEHERAHGSVPADGGTHLIPDAAARPRVAWATPVLGQLAPPKQKAPDLSGAFSWCARGDLNPHALSDTGT